MWVRPGRMNVPALKLLRGERDRGLEKSPLGCPARHVFLSLGWNQIKYVPVVF
jgi:hypothetical protein